MKEKILASLRKSIGKTDVSDRTLSVIADTIGEKITEESQIEDACKSFIPLVREFQGNINAVLASKAPKKTTTEDGNGEAHREKPDDTMPEWAKSIVGMVSTLNDRMDRQDENARRENILSSVRKSLKENGATNEAVLDIAIGLSEIDLSQSVKEITEKCKATYDQQYSKLYGDSRVEPGAPGKMDADANKKILEDLKTQIEMERGVGGQQK